MYGNNMNIDPSNPHPLTASDYQKQPLEHHSSSTFGAPSSSDTCMEPLPFDAAESHRYPVMNGGTFDGKIPPTYSFDMEAIHPASQRFAHHEDHHEGNRKDGNDNKLKGSHDDDQLKSDDGHHDFLASNFFGV